MLYSPSVYRLMSKKPSDYGTNRASSRDRLFSRKTPLLPLDQETSTLSLKEKLLLLHFHENNEDEPPSNPDQEIVQEIIDQSIDQSGKRKKFERSITAPVLPIQRAMAQEPNSAVVKKRSNTLASPAIGNFKGESSSANRKKSEHGTLATQGSSSKQAQHRLDTVKQVIGGCCSKLKKVGQCATGVSTASGSVRSASGSG